MEAAVAVSQPGHSFTLSTNKMPTPRRCASFFRERCVTETALFKWVIADIGTFPIIAHLRVQGSPGTRSTKKSYHGIRQ
jgi:hypothetical protein